MIDIKELKIKFNDAFKYLKKLGNAQQYQMSFLILKNHVVNLRTYQAKQ